MAKTFKGIDVSHYQGSNVDFNKVKDAGYSFVMLNAGYGKYIWQKDPDFEHNYRSAKEAGLYVGAYWYSYATTSSEAEAEAKIFLEVIKGKKFEMPIAFDIEDKCHLEIPSAYIGDIIKAFCGYCESKGYYTMLYSYADFLNRKIPADCKIKYCVWLAEFDVANPTYKNQYGIWQYTSKGTVNGVNGNCDCNYAYKDFPKIIKENSFNGYVRSKSELLILDSKGYKKGDKTSGVLALKQLIILANSLRIIKQGVDNNAMFGDGTQKAVNELLQKWGYEQNGIAGDNFIVKLQDDISMAIK